MKPAESEGAKRIQAILGDQFQVLEFDESTHSSVEAAAAVGCDVAQIAKSMLFRAADGRPVLVVTSGANRVDDKKIRVLLGQKVSRADAAFVAACSGFAPGGVPPVGHVVPPAIFLDQDLRAYPSIWAARVLPMPSSDLRRMTLPP
jgi:prolyl-tRNA editing enzyme YbaK/EbsC (Cys-tRNA(Pro) deacylase)